MTFQSQVQRSNHYTTRTHHQIPTTQQTSCNESDSCLKCCLSVCNHFPTCAGPAVVCMPHLQSNFIQTGSLHHQWNKVLLKQFSSTVRCVQSSGLNSEQSPPASKWLPWPTPPCINLKITRYGEVGSGLSNAIIGCKHNTRTVMDFFVAQKVNKCSKNFVKIFKVLLYV